MRFYHTNIIFQNIINKRIWKISTKEKNVFITFDDAPNNGTTQWILSKLEEYHAKATFFCIGKNVEKFPKLFDKIIEKKHKIGNHTFDHLNGWKSENNKYVANVKKFNKYYETYLFRPPYGKIKSSQAKFLNKNKYKIIMWDILSYDFDKNIDKKKALKKMIRYTQKGSIVVFHDSEKAFENLRYLLPRYLEYLKNEGFNFKTIDL